MKNKDNEQDKEIERLSLLIKAKEDRLTKTKRYAYNTNMSLPLDGKEYNLHTITEINVLIYLISRLNRLNQDFEQTIHKYHSQFDLTSCPFYIGNYGIDSWIQDIEARVEKVLTQKESRLLDSLKITLEELTSEESKRLKKLKQIKTLLGES